MYVSLLANCTRHRPWQTDDIHRSCRKQFSSRDKLRRKGSFVVVHRRRWWCASVHVAGGYWTSRVIIRRQPLRCLLPAWPPVRFETHSKRLEVHILRFVCAAARRQSHVQQYGEFCAFVDALPFRAEQFLKRHLSYITRACPSCDFISCRQIVFLCLVFFTARRCSKALHLHLFLWTISVSL